MPSGRIYFPGANPVRDRQGGRVGGELRFYLNKTTTPATVYADSGLTTPHPTPLLSDDSGVFPSIFADTSLFFSGLLTTHEADPQNLGYDDLSANVTVTTGPAAWKKAEAWAAGVNYTDGPPASFVIAASAPYVCLIAHLSGASFAADLAAGKWIGVGAPSNTPGPANTLTIGTISTVATGGPATASLTGVSPNQTLNLGLPTGATGAAGTIVVGTVTTVAPGQPATVTNVGTSTAAQFNFEIPAGVAGAGSGNVNPTGVIAANDIALFGNTAGTVIKSGGPLGALATKSTINNADWSGTDLSVVNGGTGLSAVAAHCLTVGNGASALVVLGTGTAGQVLTSGGAGADPAWAAAGGGATVPGTPITNGATPTSITVGSIPAGYKRLTITVDGLKCNTASTTIQVDISTDGVTFTGAPVTISASFGAGTPFYGSFEIVGYAGGVSTLVGGLGSAAGTNPGISAATAVVPVSMRHTGGIVAVRLSPSSGPFQSGGTITATVS